PPNRRALRALVKSARGTAEVTSRRRLIPAVQYIDHPVTAFALHESDLTHRDGLAPTPTRRSHHDSLDYPEGFDPPPAPSLSPPAVARNPGRPHHPRGGPVRHVRRPSVRPADRGEHPVHGPLRQHQPDRYRLRPVHRPVLAGDRHRRKGCAAR